MLEVAIVGGGPGGLMAARYLDQKLGDSCRCVIYESSGRLGGKVMTRTFDRAPAQYEAGAAELYDYSIIGPDPLRQLVDELGLETVLLDGEQVQLDGTLIRGVDGMRERFGKTTGDAIESFRGRCQDSMSPEKYYDSSPVDDNEHPWARITGEELLQREVNDPHARRFIRAMSRSDIATDGQNTSGLNALKNFLMDLDGYIDLYSIRGGNDELTRGLASEIDAEVHLDHRVIRIGRTPAGRYGLKINTDHGSTSVEADVALVCLPHTWLSTIQWGDTSTRLAMRGHVAHFDHPGHYLRVAILFEKPFWGDQIEGAWFMSEAFGGCCVYVEGARLDVSTNGVLNWLITGPEAVAYCNVPDQELVDAALRTLPPALGDAREHFVEAKIHRWMSSVSGLPGGQPTRDPEVNHCPDPNGSPGLFVVGDYLFDSTLNGVLDSADFATDLIVREASRLSR